jgi:hypothetical protein
LALLLAPLLALSLAARPLAAQPLGGVPARLDAMLGAQATGATDAQAPFWLVAGRHGRLGRAAGHALGRAALTLAPAPGRRLTLSAGLDVLARASGTPTARGASAAYVHQGYLRLHAGPARLTAGRIEHVQGLIDTTLSAGGTTWSANATPVPAVRLDLARYVGVPGTRGFVAVRGSFAHGWFEADRFVERAYLHSKQLYLRFLPERVPVQVHAGVVHNVMWAGTHPELGDLADGWRAFRRVVFQQELEGDEGLPGEGRNSAVGNAVAAYDVAVAGRARGWRGRAYRQFYIETGVSAQLRSPWDGLWGVSLRRAPEAGGRLVERVVYEHLRFVRQNARYDLPGALGRRGRERYYTSTDYEDGWTYAGRILGTPLVLLDADAPRLARTDLPGGTPFAVASNIVVAHHLGLAGQVAPGWRYRALVTYHRHHGSRDNRLARRRDQVSALAEVTARVWPARGLAATAALALDAGQVFADRAGLLVGLTWRPTLGDGGTF